jgi:nitroreductase
MTTAANGQSPDLDVLERIMRERRSVRRYQAEAPPDELIERVLELATAAPSASNKQPWRFFVVKNRDRIREAADAVRAEVDAVAGHVAPDSEEAFRAYGDYFTRFEAAPVIVVPAHRGQRVLSHLVDEALAGDRRMRIEVMERDSGLISTSLAIMNLLLAVHAVGLGASAMTGPLLAAHRLREIFGIPGTWEVAAVVPIGWPGEVPKAPDRKRLQAVLRWIR